MNELSYQLTPNYSELKKKELWLGLELLIDGKSPLMAPEADDFDIMELILSVSPSNENSVYILTCSCGIPGCAGYHDGIKVSVSNHHVEWVDQDQGFTYTFAKGTYFATLQAVYKDLIGWHKHAESRGLTLRLFPDWHNAADVIQSGADLKE